MKKATKWCALVLAVCMAAVMLTACSSAPASTASGASAGGEADGQVVVNLAKDVAPESMDPINAEDGFSMELIGATMSGLYTLDADDNLVPDLATECTVSEDGMTYTFKLREDAKWSNGDALTAHDFVFAWKRLADPAVAGAYAWMLDEVLSVKNAAEIATGELPVDEIASREGWQDLRAVKNGAIYNADADMTSRPGPRLLDAAQALADFVHGMETDGEPEA